MLIFVYEVEQKRTSCHAFKGSYLSNHSEELTYLIKDLFTRARTDPQFSYSQAANASIWGIHHCMTQHEGLCESRTQEGDKGKDIKVKDTGTKTGLVDTSQN